MSHDGSPNEGIVNKGVGFAKFANPKKRNGEPSDGQDAFALILNKKKCSQSANTGKKDAPNTQVSRITVDKAGDTFQAVPAPNSQISKTTVDKASDTFQRSNGASSSSLVNERNTNDKKVDGSVQVGKFSKIVDTTEMSKGPQDIPGHCLDETPVTMLLV
ncbi:hypothetical protein AgCh_005979 [Apium graveolens]